MGIRHAGVMVFALILLGNGCRQSAPLQTELERSKYQHLTSSAQIVEYLTALFNRDAEAELRIIGNSARGKPIAALLISKNLADLKQGGKDEGRLTVMLIGSQHGMEPSGAEALLLLARELLEGGLKSSLDDLDLILVPNSNPDGRDTHRRVNGDGVNLSTDYALLSAPESRAVMDALHYFKPDAVLDIHESAVLKKQTLAAQGYLTDFEAQFEAANNPNVDGEIRAYSFGCLLPELISTVSAQGLPAQRYIGEITSVTQPITHGGISLRNLRNQAGMEGAFSFLVENKLDPSTGNYPTPRNIRVRVKKQYLCITSFLAVCRTHAADIRRISRLAREKWRLPQEEGPLYLGYDYVASPTQATISVPLRTVKTGEKISRTFEYRGDVEAYWPFQPPSSYLVTTHQTLIAEFLGRHHIRYESPQTLRVVSVVPATNHAWNEPDAAPAARKGEKRLLRYSLKPGDLIIPLDQAGRRLIPLFLEHRSLSGIYAFPPAAGLFEKDEQPQLYRIVDK
jgi:hypothetical protein